MSAAEHLAEAIAVGCTRDDHDHIAMHRAEVLDEAAELVAAYTGNPLDANAQMLRRAAQAAADPSKATRMQDAADTVAKLRGSARPDFYEPGHTYTETNPAYDWAFRCDMVATHPEDGERTALGWRRFKGEWTPYAYAEDDWDLHTIIGLFSQQEAPRG